MKKLLLISLDLMLALPILGLGFAALFSSIIGSQSYLLALARLENRTLSLSVASQQVAEALDADAVNYSAAYQAASVVAKENGVAAIIANRSFAQGCASALEVCRLVTVSGSVRLLVVSYENSG